MGVCDSKQQKGMPHKFYHGRTGRVWNVTKKALGVEINKVHRQRQIVKRIHVRLEHVRPSKSQLGHLARVKSNEEIKKEAKESGKRAPERSSSGSRRARAPSSSWLWTAPARARCTRLRRCPTSSGRWSAKLPTRSACLLSGRGRVHASALGLNYLISVNPLHP